VAAAGQHERHHALGVQQRDVALLAHRVAERVADRHEPGAVVGHRHRAERDLREVRVGDVVHDHADRRRRRARQRLRRPVRDVAERGGRLDHALAQRLADAALGPVDHARRRRQRHPGVARHVVERRAPFGHSREICHSR
jgi:hypothetical protein